MRDGNSKDYSNVEEKLKQLNEKVTKLYGILEKFGLDVITKMGHTNLLVNKLTDKVEKLYNTIIDIKSLSPQLNNIIEGQREIEDEIGLLKILLSNLKFSRTELNDKAIVTEQENSSDKKNQILNQFKNIKEAIISDTSPSIIKEKLKNLKEVIFEFTGGHKTLYEISKIINRLNTAESLSENFDLNDPKSIELSNYILKNMDQWLNALKLK